MSTNWFGNKELWLLRPKMNSKVWLPKSRVKRKRLLLRMWLKSKNEWIHMIIP
jgi:hypothetical protein